MKKVVYAVVAACFSCSVKAGSYDDFFRALIRDDPGEVRAWIDKGFDANARDPNGQPAIVRALLVESWQTALALAKAPGLDPNARNASGETPLMMAALKGRLEVCEVLIERGAEVAPASGWTPLHYAAAGDSLPVTRLLLQHGARLDARAPNRRTPLMLAALHASEEVIGTLLATGADPQLRDENDATAADLAARSGRERLAAALRERVKVDPLERGNAPR
ncbi:MAG TPA: ankyrin repeat domain-containing protein [Methylibium sp.]|uniref:ankyrin repeat domain-containing protein n=1 Tax=Methylibium sp. TaxID=2067992 RepID=UPI002DBE04A0|nr:ankyrin repeat domain-containing protein [Methylibium sp.]HEU4460620.1 ankyrin repeat domain-containing protein [Methylibium sp.]